VGLLLGYVFTRRQEITKRDDQDGKD
jgi:hypothetical protein